MARKRDITNLLVTQLKRIDGSVIDEPLNPYSPHTTSHDLDQRVFSRFKYIDEINDFPTICIYNATESRIHIGAGVKYANYNANIRGYIKTSEDTSITDADTLLDDIEFILQGMRKEDCSLEIVDVRILSTETDEGLFSPYAIAEVNVEIVYEVAV